MLITYAKNLLKQLNHVVNVATSNTEGEPNAAVKVFLMIDERYIYLADYSLGTTWQNLKANPKISISFEDIETNKGYRINGVVEIISDGPEYERMVTEAQRIQTAIVVNRVIEGVQRNKRYKEHIINTAEKFVAYKTEIHKIVEFGPQGALRTEDFPGPK